MDLEVYTKVAKDTIEMEHEMVFLIYVICSVWTKLRKCITKMSSIYLTFWMIIKLATLESEHCYKGQEHAEHVRLVCHHHPRQRKNRHDNWIFIFLQKSKVTTLWDWRWGKVQLLKNKSGSNGTWTCCWATIGSQVRQMDGLLRVLEEFKLPWKSRCVESVLHDTSEGCLIKHHIWPARRNT